MLDSARLIASYLAAVNRDAFLADSEKQDAVLRLGKLRTKDTDKRIQELGKDLLLGTLNPAIQVEVLEVLRHRDEKRSVWRKLLEFYEEYLGKATDPLAAHRIAMTGGDPDLGHALFLNHLSAQCLRCHALGGQGGTVGPDLKGIATRHDADYLLESLVYPSAKVVDGYGIVTVTLQDGKTLAGVLQSKTPETLTLLDGTTSRTFPTSDLKEITPPLSAMPPMAALLTPRELRDVLAYLMTLK